MCSEELLAQVVDEVDLGDDAVEGRVVGHDRHAVGAEDRHQVGDLRGGLERLQAARHEVGDRLGGGALRVVEERHQHVALVDDAFHAVAFAEHHHLADVVEAHALDGLLQRDGGGERVVLAVEVAARHQVAQVAGLRAVDEAVVHHPEVVEHLAQVLGARVADEGDDVLRFLLLAAVAERGAEQGAHARTRQHAFLAQEFARGVERIGIAHGEGLVHQLQVADGPINL